MSTETIARRTSAHPRFIHAIKRPIRAGATPALALALGVSALTAPQASANEIGFFTTVFDTDWTTAGVGGLRGSGSGTINVTGVAGPITQS
jgi:hypothetical protein